jgi:hypothetical protein
MPRAEPAVKIPASGIAELVREPPAAPSPVEERQDIPARAEPPPVHRTTEPVRMEPAAARAQPVVAAAPPLESAATPFALRDIERIVEEKVRSRLANAQSAQARPAQSPGPEPENAPPPARKRPASAAEASLIGKLSASTFQPMLFGVRRR